MQKFGCSEHLHVVWHQVGNIAVEIDLAMTFDLTPPHYCLLGL